VEGLDGYKDYLVKSVVLLFLVFAITTEKPKWIIFNMSRIPFESDNSNL